MAVICTEAVRSAFAYRETPSIVLFFNLLWRDKEGWFPPGKPARWGTMVTSSTAIATRNNWVFLGNNGKAKISNKITVHRWMLHRLSEGEAQKTTRTTSGLLFDLIIRHHWKECNQWQQKFKVEGHCGFHYFKPGSPNFFVRGPHRLLYNSPRAGHLT